MNNNSYKWSILTFICIIIAIIDYNIMIKQEDGSNNAIITAIILSVCILFGIICVVMVNINNTKENNTHNNLNNLHSKNIIVKCPYCGSRNTKKISKMSKASSVAVFGVLAAGKVVKEWHCNNCKSDF